MNISHLITGGFEANEGIELAYYDHNGKAITPEKPGFPFILSEELLASADHSECICAMKCGVQS